MDQTQLAHDFELLSSILVQRIDEDPRAAISAARTILAAEELFDETNRQVLASIVLTDAGSECNDLEAVNEAISLLEKLHLKLATDPNIMYNLANALITRANLTVLPLHADWCVVTSADRVRAKKLFQTVGEHPASERNLRARALTNLGNALARNWRLIEAYDCYARAIEYDPENGVAISNAAKALDDLVRYGLAYEDDVAPVIAKLVRKAKECQGSIPEIAGAAAGAKIQVFLADSAHSGEIPDLTGATEYQRFVAANRLALAPTIEGLNLQLNRWDSLRMAPILDEVGKSGIPPVFAMFNVLKADFLAARYVAHAALSEACPESGKYYDTLDFAKYGASISLMGIAQKSCIDLLDKAAVALNSYLVLSNKSEDVYFNNLLLKPPPKNGGENASREYKREVVQHVLDGDFPLIALGEVARDLNGYLKEKKAIRHATTHRFTVLHDIGNSPSRESNCIEHFALEQFERHLIESLQVARAVLFYFVYLISVHERRKALTQGVVGVIDIPDHDFIRGEG